MMSDRTPIEWTAGADGTPGSTWNPIRAKHRTTGKRGWSCVKVSPGCVHCYAQAINRRLGTGEDYTVPAAERVELSLDEKTLTAPLRWRTPRRVFVCSMTDLFEERVPDEWIEQIHGVMALATQHTFQVLTKRAERMARWWLDRRPAPGEPAPSGPDLSNLWLGVSAEDQARADERIPWLLKTPVAVRFVSLEPLLGPIDLRRYVRPQSIRGLYADPPLDLPEHRRLDWLIVGGESGPGARPCDLAWIRSLVQQAKAAGVAVFVKQVGARPILMLDDRQMAGWWEDRGTRYYVQRDGSTTGAVALRDRKGGDMAEFPEDLRVREFPR